MKLIKHQLTLLRKFQIPNTHIDEYFWYYLSLKAKRSGEWGEICWCFNNFERAIPSLEEIMEDALREYQL